MTKKNEDDVEVQHFDSSIVKIDADGNRVLSSTLYPGETLAAEEDAHETEAVEDDSEDTDADESKPTGGSAKAGASEDVAKAPEPTE